MTKAQDTPAAIDRHALREEVFSHGCCELRLVMPQAADELIDESAFNEDERLPYWADLWPAARTLSRHLLDHPPRSERAIELGCGLALPSLVLRHLGIDVLATDYEGEALEFVRENAKRNGLREPATRTLDWRQTPRDLGRFDLIVAADVCYEQRNAVALADLLPQIIEPRGRALLADPGRRYLGVLLTRLSQSGWVHRDLAVHPEPPNTAVATPSKVRIIELARR